MISRKYEDVHWNIDDHDEEANAPFLAATSALDKRGDKGRHPKDKGGSGGSSAVKARKQPAPSAGRHRGEACGGASLFFWLNIVFVDSIGAFFECLLRIVSLTLYICLCCLSTLCCCGRAMSTKSLLLEILLDAAVMLSLLFPYFIIYSFRNVSESEEWDLLPIKTVLGDVDLRRYIVIAYGQGSAASNIDSFNAETCMDARLGSCIYPPNSMINSINKMARGH